MDQQTAEPSEPAEPAKPIFFCKKSKKIKIKMKKTLTLFEMLFLGIKKITLKEKYAFIVLDVQLEIFDSNRGDIHRGICAINWAESHGSARVNTNKYNNAIKRSSFMPHKNCDQ